MVKYTGRGLVVNRPGVLSKVQMLNLVLGVGVFSLLPKFPISFYRRVSHFAAFQTKLHQNWLTSVLALFALSGPARDTPHIAQYPFAIAEGGIAPICLVFKGYRASIAEIPLLRGGYRTSTLYALQGGKRSEKGEGVSHPIGHVETPRTP